MILGVHVSGAGKIYQAFDIAESLGCNTMQIFSRSPMSWRRDGISMQDIRQFRARRKKSKVNPVFIHISYLINLASPDNRLYHGSIKAYLDDIKEAEELGADYIVTHMGSHKKTSEDAGIKRFIQALNIILEKTSGSKVGILLENTAGSGSWLGYRFYHHQKILNGVKEKNRIGLCIDTAHAYLAGYDLSTRQGLKKMLDEIDEMAGLDLIKLVHLNDAAGKLGSHHDRHEHIGKGQIGQEGMKRIIRYFQRRNVPMVLETPKTSQDSDKNNLAMVRKLKA